MRESRQNAFYVLLQGQVSAVDYRVQEAVYGFFQFYPIELFGVMEILGGMERYKTSLAAVEKVFSCGLEETSMSDG